MRRVKGVAFFLSSEKSTFVFSCVYLGASAIVAQQVEHNPPTVGVASSNLVYRSHLILNTMIDFERLGKTVKLCTRGGLEVVSWRVQEDTPDTFFPIRATIKLEDGTTTEVSYNRNGRRFINTESEWDLEAVRLQRRDSSIEKLDTMPDVMRAIECVRKKDFLGIRSANKYSTSTNTEKLRYNYIIGTSDEGLG